jgi:AraC-like DNA-binding protein
LQAVLFARGKIAVADTSVTLSVAVGGGTLVLAIVRRNAVFDTRVVPRHSSLRPAGGVVIVVLEGRVVWHRTGAIVDAPCMFVVPDDSSPAFDEAQYRTEGPLLRAVEIHVARAAVEEPRAISGTIANAAERYHTACFDDALRDERNARAHELLTTLGEDVGSDADAPANRLWQALASSLERLDVGSTMALVALATGVSERQARRDLQSTVERMRLPYAGWRDAAKRFRVRLALVLLSAPGASIGEVAHAVGYRHGEALANAFADAGMAPPGRIRRALLALHEGRDELETLLNNS